METAAQGSSTDLKQFVLLKKNVKSHAKSITWHLAMFYLIYCSCIHKCYPFHSVEQLPDSGGSPSAVQQSSSHQEKLTQEELENIKELGKIVLGRGGDDSESSSEEELEDEVMEAEAVENIKGTKNVCRI